MIIDIINTLNLEENNTYKKIKYFYYVIHEH